MQGNVGVLKNSNSQSGFTPLKTGMSPEKWEDDFPFEMASF